jgi:hypothetical protein
MATTLIGSPRRRHRVGASNRPRAIVFQIEILAEINEFMPRERSDHERHLAADDLRQAIEEVYQPIEASDRARAQKSH